MLSKQFYEWRIRTMQQKIHKLTVRNEIIEKWLDNKIIEKWFDNNNKHYDKAKKLLRKGENICRKLTKKIHYYQLILML